MMIPVILCDDRDFYSLIDELGHLLYDLVKPWKHMFGYWNWHVSLIFTNASAVAEKPVKFQNDLATTIPYIMTEICKVLQ